MSATDNKEVGAPPAPPNEPAAEAAPAPADLESQLAAKTQEAQEYYDRMLRLAAEVENLKKRQERERADLLQFANENLIRELLPVLDNLERALEHGRQGDGPAPLLEGLELVHQDFLKALKRFGVSPFVSEGQPFDPNYHHAVIEEKASEVGDQTVLQELQKGYLIHSRLLRPALVVVARQPGKNTASTD